MKALIMAMIFVLPFQPIMETEYVNPVSPYTVGDCFEEEIKEEVVIEKSIEPPYFVSTYKKDGYDYITEKSLKSICNYIGDIYGLDPVILQSIAFVESSYRVNPNKNGLCQVIPKWNKERMKRLGLNNLLDPYQNILCCADIMTELLKKTNGDMTFALMSYNLGYYGAKQLYPKTTNKYPSKVFKAYKKIKGADYE